MRSEEEEWSTEWPSWFFVQSQIHFYPPSSVVLVIIHPVSFIDRDSAADCPGGCRCSLATSQLGRTPAWKKAFWKHRFPPFSLLETFHALRLPAVPSRCGGGGG